MMLLQLLPTPFSVKQWPLISSSSFSFLQSQQTELLSEKGVSLGREEEEATSDKRKEGERDSLPSSDSHC